MSARSQLIDILKEEVQLAVGCTEPASIAYASALAAENSRGSVRAVKVVLSRGVFKNGYAVGIPGTDEKGIALAAALGVLKKNSQDKLELLKELSVDIIKKGREMVQKGLIEISYNCDLDGIFVEIMLETEKDHCRVVINGGHTALQLIELNGQRIFASTNTVHNEKKLELANRPLDSIIEEAASLPFQEISFLITLLEHNKKIAAQGLVQKRGLGVGYGLTKLLEKGLLGKDLINETKALVAAASDARMAGVELAVNTSFGSGNQGILATLTIAQMAEYLGSTDEQLARALAISHLVNGYVKANLGKLSPMCGCAIAAGLGVAAASGWLLDGKRETINGAMKNLLANISGMLCDGAKGGCSFKLATSAGEALTAAFLAKEKIFVNLPEGIVDENIEETIKNITNISTEGMQNLDSTIIDLVLKREQKIIS